MSQQCISGVVFVVLRCTASQSKTVQVVNMPPPTTYTTLHYTTLHYTTLHYTEGALTFDLSNITHHELRGERSRFIQSKITRDHWCLILGESHPVPSLVHTSACNHNDCDVLRKTYLLQGLITPTYTIMLLSR